MAEKRYNIIEKWKCAVHFSCPFRVFGLLWSTEILAISIVADVVDICNIYDGLPPVRSARKQFAAKFEYISHSIYYYVNHNVAEKKILMIKELYKTENMCFCQSIFIQLVHVFNQIFVNETNWQRFKRKYGCTYIWSKHKLLIDNFNLLLSPICLNSYWAISFILNHLWVSFFVTCRQNLFDFAGFTGLATLVSVVYVPV